MKRFLGRFVTFSTIFLLGAVAGVSVSYLSHHWPNTAANDLRPVFGAKFACESPDFIGSNYLNYTEHLGAPAGNPGCKEEEFSGAKVVRVVRASPPYLVVEVDTGTGLRYILR